MNQRRTWDSASGCIEVNETINYYNKHAGEYYKNTIGADFDHLQRKFVSFLPENARIIDVGCGSGRDVKAFCDMGYRAIGLDASEELANEAKKKLGIEVIVGDMTTWKAQEPFDGVWCCASLLHLHEDEANAFFQNLQCNLKPDGILFISVKEGIKTGYDEKGRYMRNYTEQDLRSKLRNASFEIIEIDTSEDSLGRDGFRWLNAFCRLK
ncbi:MAG: class I SAM-dependent methyltransferase [Clostridiales bacterium]|nr:class I SAM-dependent methyltransferase [Clostridiales bacterium]